MAAGRPQKYVENVEPYLPEIKKMALTMTEEQIAKTLGISYSSFRKYKGLYPELREALKKGRKELVMELQSTMIKRAKGYKYTETKKYYKVIDGVLTEVGKEVYEKYMAPDVAALNLLLKNYDPNWSNDPQTLELRRQELEIRKKTAEENDW